MGWDARLGHTDARHGWRDLPGRGGGVLSSLNTGSFILSPISFLFLFFFFLSLINLHFLVFPIWIMLDL